MGSEFSTDNVDAKQEENMNFNPTKLNLYKLVNALKLCTNFRDQFLQEFPEWERRRIQIMKYLCELAEELDCLRGENGTSRNTSSTATRHSTPTATNHNAELAQLKIAENIQKVGSAIAEDSDGFQKLMNYADRLRELANAVEEVCYYSVIKQFFGAVSPRICKFEFTDKEIEEISKDAISTVRHSTHGPLSTILEGKMTSLCEHICNDKALVPLPKEVCMLLKNSPNLISAAHLSKTAFRCLFGNSNCRAFSEFMGCAVADYAELQGNKIVRDAVAQIHLPEDMQRGYVAAHSARVLEAKEELKLELSFFRKIYEGL